MKIKELMNNILGRGTSTELQKDKATGEAKEEGHAATVEEARSTPPEQVALHPTRILIEFYCQMCCSYIYAKLNTSLDGNHIVVCPKCGHMHYRVVQNGIITEERYNSTLCVAEELHFTRSAAVHASERRQYGNIARIREAEASGFHK